MNIEKVNATLNRAVVLFKEDEINLLRNASKGGGVGAELSGLQAPLARMAHEIAEETGKPFSTVLDAVVTGVSEAAARQLSGDVTEEQLIEWMATPAARVTAQKIAEQL